MSESNFNQELVNLINMHSRENVSDTPDYILAQYLLWCLEAFEITSNAREAWYGRRSTQGDRVPGMAGEPDIVPPTGTVGESDSGNPS